MGSQDGPKCRTTVAPAVIVCVPDSARPSVRRTQPADSRAVDANARAVLKPHLVGTAMPAPATAPAVTRLT
jgi:hypothetical protein